MFNLFKKKDPVKTFWLWFEKYEKALRDFQKNPQEIMNLVYDNIKHIQAGLAIEFEPPKNNIINITISANGDRTLFPVVEEIVERAPEIQGWSFVAFRQRMPADKLQSMTLKAADHELNPNTMRFLPIVSGGSLDIIVYVNNVTESNYKQTAYDVFLLLDNILGEYDCVKKVRKYDFQNMTTDPEELHQSKPLLELAEYVDNFYKSSFSKKIV